MDWGQHMAAKRTSNPDQVSTLQRQFPVCISHSEPIIMAATRWPVIAIWIPPYTLSEAHPQIRLYMRPTTDSIWGPPQTLSRHVSIWGRPPPQTLYEATTDPTACYRLYMQPIIYSIYEVYRTLCMPIMPVYGVLSRLLGRLAPERL